MSAGVSTVCNRRPLLVLVVWFALLMGTVEGLILLFFQRINWANWGRLIHVLPSIVWISPIVDGLIFGVLAAALILAARSRPKLSITRAAFFLFTMFTVYAWAAATERLTYWACVPLGIGVAASATRWFSQHQESVLRFCAKTLPWLATAVFALAFISSGRQWLQERIAIDRLPPAPPNAPNVLVIVIDTLRADHLSSYGYYRPTSPNLDSLVGQSVVFDDAITASSWTLPSHASMLTGRYTFEHGADNVKPMSLLSNSMHALGPRYPVLSEALAARGYRTAAFSGNRIYFSREMGFGRGFSRFEDFSTSDMFLRTVLTRRCARVFNYPKLRRAAMRLGFRDPGVRKRAPEINHSLFQWIDGDRTLPFFAFVNYFDVHSPYISETQKFSHGKGTPADYYDDGIADLDTHIGELLQELQKRHLSQTTLLIVTSDHGELLGEHGMTGHWNAGLYRQLIRVPLFVRMPGVVPAGLRIATPVSTSDLPATIVELLGTGGQKPFPGPGLTQLWKSSTPNPDWPYPLSEVTDIFYDSGQKSAGHWEYMASMVNSRWHCIFHPKGTAELFDLLKDPEEEHNLAASAEGQQVVRDFGSRVQELVSQRHPHSPAVPVLEQAVAWKGR